MQALVLDVETTGLIANRTLRKEMQPEVIEFYGCMARLDDGAVTAELEALIKPQNSIGANITKITGIDDALITKAKAQPFAAHADAIQKFIEQAPLVIGHNISFDMEMLDIEFERLGKKLQWPRSVCTLEETVFIRGFRLSQSQLHEYLFNEPFAGAHRARADVQALLRCCIELHRRGMIK